MHALRTFRVEESLGPRRPPVRTAYTYQAPDRALIEVESGPEIVWIGPDRYQRDGPDRPWRLDHLDAGLTVPSFAWDGPAGPGSQRYVAPRVVGTASVDGADTRVVSFFTEIGQLPAWFRLWVDGDGLVRRAEMRARGHVMDQRYHDLDAPVAVEPPLAATPAEAGRAPAQAPAAAPVAASASGAGTAAPASAPREVGTDAVDGVATRVVAFFEPLGTSPAWFRQWIDADGLVRRARMDTAGAHFMDEHLHDFDAPLTIEPPVPRP
jgi:hypothetical protein